MKAIPPPADFAAPEKALWRRSIVALDDLGVWNDSDRDALERFCRSSASARLARLRIAAAVQAGRDPYITKGSMGQQVVGPLIELERRARLDADALARELGLTPMARRRLGLSRLADELDVFLEEVTR
jgi:P27 family predicted phage terminase small subunit